MNADFISHLKAGLHDFELFLGEPSYRYIGLNYIEAEVLSYKFYFTYIGMDLLSLENGVPRRIFERVLEYKESFSHYHFSNYLVPGCGVTVSIKFSRESRVSYGVYFRINCNPEPYIHKFLSSVGLPCSREYVGKFDDSGVMKYVSLNEGGNVVERSYVYCKEPRFFDMSDADSGMEFSSSDCIEISTDWDHLSSCDNIRMIGISNKNIEKNPDLSRVASLKEAARLFDFVDGYDLFLHGYYVNRHEKSVFFFDRAALGERQ
jgi:hypothetical protein